MFYSSTKPPAGPTLIADMVFNVVFTAMNEERVREKRQLNLIVHNLVESTSDCAETMKCNSVKI